MLAWGNSLSYKFIWREAIARKYAGFLNSIVTRKNKRKNEGNTKMKKFMNEFKEFISRGNVMDMAIGVIIGGAFTAIVNSLVNDVMMPVLSLITGGLDFSKLCIALGEGEGAATLNYGALEA